MRCERYSATRGKEGYRKHVNLFERTICDPDSAGSGNSRQRRGNQCQDDRGASGIIRKIYGTDFKCSAEGRICCQYPRLPRRLSSDQEAGELYDRQDSPHSRRTAHSIPATQQEDIQERPVELVVNELWGNLQEQIESTLDSVTLLDLMNSYNDKICFSYTI